MKLWDLSGYSEKSNIQEAYLPKTSISGQIVSEIAEERKTPMAQHTNPSKFDLGLNVYVTLSMELAVTSSNVLRI